MFREFAQANPDWYGNEVRCQFSLRNRNQQQSEPMNTSEEGEKSLLKQNKKRKYQEFQEGPKSQGSQEEPEENEELEENEEPEDSEELDDIEEPEKSKQQEKHAKLKSKQTRKRYKTSHSSPLSDNINAAAEKIVNYDQDSEVNDVLMQDAADAKAEKKDVPQANIQQEWIYLNEDEFGTHCETLKKLNPNATPFQLISLLMKSTITLKNKTKKNLFTNESFWLKKRLQNYHYKDLFVSLSVHSDAIFTFVIDKTKKHTDSPAFTAIVNKDGQMELKIDKSLCTITDTKMMHDFLIKNFNLTKKNKDSKKPIPTSDILKTLARKKSGSSENFYKLRKFLFQNQDIKDMRSMSSFEFTAHINNKTLYGTCFPEAQFTSYIFNCDGLRKYLYPQAEPTKQMKFFKVTLFEEKNKENQSDKPQIELIMTSDLRWIEVLEIHAGNRVIGQDLYPYVMNCQDQLGIEELFVCDESGPYYSLEVKEKGEADPKIIEEKDPDLKELTQEERLLLTRILSEDDTKDRKWVPFRVLRLLAGELALYEKYFKGLTLFECKDFISGYEGKVTQNRAEFDITKSALQQYSVSEWNQEISEEATRVDQNKVKNTYTFEALQKPKIMLLLFKILKINDYKGLTLGELSKLSMKFDNDRRLNKSLKKPIAQKLLYKLLADKMVRKKESHLDDHAKDIKIKKLAKDFLHNSRFWSRKVSQSNSEITQVFQGSSSHQNLR